MSKEVSFDDFLLLFKISVEKHKNTNDPIPELNLSKTGKIKGCLKSPFQSFGGIDLYPTIYDKASKLFYEINKGHNLSNGNKRMAYVVTEYFLFINNIVLDISDDKIYELSLNVAKSHSDNQSETIEYIKNTLQNKSNMTKKDFEIKIEAAKSNKALNDKQREQIIAMYEKKIAELEPGKKAEPKHASGKIITFDDGFKWKVVSKDFAEKNFSKTAIYKIYESDQSESLVEDESDLVDPNAVFAVEESKPSPSPKKAAAKKAEPKKDSKKIDYDCDDLIAKAKKSKAAAKDREAAPKKTEVTKSKEAIEKVHDKVQKNVEAGKFGKAQLQKLITETEELLTFLKKTLKSL